MTVAPHPLVLADQSHVGVTAAEIVANRLRARPGLRALLPTGHTPLPMYAALREHAASGALPTGSATLFQLDEYRGIPAADAHSYRHYIEEEIGPLGFGTRHVLTPEAEDIEAECRHYQALLDQAPVDLAVLGLGTDGHVAFNEPGSRPEEGVRPVTLRPETRRAAAGDFGSLEAVPTAAVTVGLRTLLAARELLVLVTGAKKGRALRAMLFEPPTTRGPASLLRQHPRLTVICDRDAAVAAGVGLPDARTASRAIVVLGHREPPKPEEGRATSESLERLRRAERLCERRRPLVVLFTGYASSDGLTEAEEMAETWTFPGVPVLLEMAGRDTAENASRSLPLLLALGSVEEVTVVTSAWHLRARFFFAPYGRHGLRLRMRHEWRGGNWPRMLHKELRLAVGAPAARRRAGLAARGR